MASIVKLNYVKVGTITAVDNSIDVVPGAISFSSGVEIEGHIAAIVQPPEIEFSSLNIEIVGHSVSIPVIPPEINFSSENITVAGFSGIVENIPAAIKFSSSALPLPLDNMVSVVPGEMEFSNPIIEIDASQITVFSEPAAIKMGLFNVKVYVIEVSSTAMSSIFPAPPALILSSPDIEIDGSEIVVTSTPGQIEFSSSEIGVISNLVMVVPPMIEFSAPNAVVSIFDPEFPNTKTVYKFVLTGAEDGTTDIDMEISSFQTRMEKDVAAYLNVVIPGIEYADEIVDRTNGTLELYLQYVEVDTNIETYSEKILSTQFDDISVYDGPTNKSIILAGYESEAQTAMRIINPKSVILSDSWINFTRTISGKITASLAKPHPALKVGDTAIMESNSFVVGGITWVKSSTFQTVEMTEATS